MRCQLVDLEADKGILSHPYYFLTQRGIAIETLTVQVDMDGNGCTVDCSERTPGDR